VTTGEAGTPGIDGGMAPPGTVTGQPVVNTMEVADLDATLASIVSNGGTLLGDVNVIPGVGRYAYALDPAGIAFGVMESEPMPEGAR
jgi:predicted enzyme related to lactoylglutathione lyase